jgi:hypothetical protein
MNDKSRSVNFFVNPSLFNFIKHFDNKQKKIAARHVYSEIRIANLKYKNNIDEEDILSRVLLFALERYQNYLKKIKRRIPLLQIKNNIKLSEVMFWKIAPELPKLIDTSHFSYITKLIISETYGKKRKIADLSRFTNSIDESENIQVNHESYQINLNFMLIENQLKKEGLFKIYFDFFKLELTQVEMMKKYNLSRSELTNFLFKIRQIFEIEIGYEN